MIYKPANKQKIQVAEETPFDNSNSEFNVDNVQDAIKEIDFRAETKEPTGFLDRTQCTISWSDANRRLTIAPVSTSFIYYVKGRKYEKTSTETVDITDTEGLWYIYYVNDTLTASQTPWTFDSGVVFVSIVYWDATNNKQILFGDERHGLTMDWATHKRLHEVEGMGVEPYTLFAGDYVFNQDGSLDSHVQFSLTNGTVHDEDLVFEISNSATPTNPFEQKLSPIAYLPKYYQDGPSGTWRKQAATAFPLPYATGSRAQYNYFNPSTSQWNLTTVTNDDYICMWILATNNISEPVVIIVGQKQYSDPLQADAEEQFSALDLTSFPFQEAVLLYRAMFKSSNTFTNTPKSILVNLDGRIASNLAQAIVNKKLTSATNFATTSGSYVAITNFTITPESGRYAIWYSADISLTANKSLCNTVATIDGVAIADSERSVKAALPNFEGQMNIITTYGFNGTEELGFKVKVSRGTFTTSSRTVILIRLGPA